MSFENEARKQLRAMLSEYGQADALRAALTEGNVNGGIFWNDCAEHGCILGTVLAATGAEDPAHAAFTLRDFEELEAWGEWIRPGDLPNVTIQDATASVTDGPYRAAMLVRWIDEWEAERVAA